MIIYLISSSFFSDSWLSPDSRAKIIQQYTTGKKENQAENIPPWGTALIRKTTRDTRKLGRQNMIIYYFISHLGYMTASNYSNNRKNRNLDVGPGTPDNRVWTQWHRTTGEGKPSTRHWSRIFRYWYLAQNSDNYNPISSSSFRGQYGEGTPSTRRQSGIFRCLHPA